MDRTELAWAAGFWDGEGSSYLAKSEGRGTAQPVARVNQSSTAGPPAVLVRLQRAIGLGRVQGPTIVDGREPLYRWEITNRADVFRTFRALAPYLSSVKRSQFASVLGVEPGDRVDRPERRLEVAWCAGLFDGEGSVYLLKHGTHPGYSVLEAGITQSSGSGLPEVLERFRSCLGIGRIYGPYAAPDGYAPVYRWKAHRQVDIKRVIESLRRHLGPVKLQQAETAITAVAAQIPLLRGNPAWGNRKTHCLNGHEYVTARVRPYRARSANGVERRPSKQCLACVREHARGSREGRKAKSGG